MRRKRSMIHIVILALAVAIAVMMFTVPLIDASLLPAGTGSDYLQLCGVLARALSREKNVGLALTLLAMVLGFGGMLVTALLTPFVRTLRKTRDGMGAFSGMLTLVPLVLLSVDSPALQELIGMTGPAGQSALAVGGYALAVLAILFILLCVSGLAVGMHLKGTASRSTSRPKTVPKPPASKRAEAERSRDKRRERAAEKPADAEQQKKDKQEAADGSGDGQSPAETMDESERAAEADPEITVVRTSDSGPACGVIEGLEGVYAGARIELGVGEEILFGRNPRYAHVVIDHNNADISRKHCSVAVEDASGKFLVTDFSRNGTFARTADAGEEMRLSQRKPTRLPKGTVLRLGRQGNLFLLK